MHVTIRRYEGIDESRTVELSRKVNESLVPKLSELPGFRGFYMIEAGNGVLSSIDLFKTAEQADESGRFAAAWMRDEKLESALPNAPKITTGNVVAHKTPQPVAVA
jgi:hypothetical protein